MEQDLNSCACGIWHNIGQDGGVGSGDSIGRAEGHRASECVHYDASYLVTRVLWAIGGFFSRLAQKMPQKRVAKKTVLGKRAR